jgi:hypothetical protein
MIAPISARRKPRRVGASGGHAPISGIAWRGFQRPAQEAQKETICGLCVTPVQHSQHLVASENERSDILHPASRASPGSRGILAFRSISTQPLHAKVILAPPISRRTSRSFLCPQPELDPGGRVFFNSAANASAGAKAAPRALGKSGYRCWPLPGLFDKVNSRVDGSDGAFHLLSN